MIFAGIWLHVHPSSVSSNSLPTYLRSTCLGTRFSIAKMSWWNLSPCSSLTSPRFSRKKKIEVGLQKVDFQTHIASHSSVRSQQVLHSILIVRCFVISQEVLANPLKRQPCISFSLIHIHTFHKVFHEAQLYVQRGQINFLRQNKRRTDDIFLPWHQWCSFRPPFIYIVILLIPAVPLTQETSLFCIPELHSE